MLARQALVKRLIAVHIPFAAVHVAWLKKKWVPEVDTANESRKWSGRPVNDVDLSLKRQMGA